MKGERYNKKTDSTAGLDIAEFDKSKKATKFAVSEMIFRFLSINIVVPFGVRKL